VPSAPQRSLPARSLRAAHLTTLDLRLSTDKPAYATGEPVTLTLEVTNAADEPQILAFTTSQEYDLTVSGGAATAVWRASCNRFYLQALHNRTIGSREVIAFSEAWDQRRCVPGSEDQGEPVPPGIYSAVGRLTTFPAALDSAPVEFTIE
jgi:hypothetical protein